MRIDPSILLSGQPRTDQAALHLALPSEEGFAALLAEDAPALSRGFTRPLSAEEALARLHVIIEDMLGQLAALAQPTGH